MNIENICGRLRSLYYHCVKSKRIDVKSLIIKPLKIDNVHAICLEAKVYIGKFSWLMGGSEKNRITLKIDEGTQVGHFAHIIAISNVHIEKKVLLADKVFISDCSHGYEDVSVPIGKQPIKIIKSVTIGEGSWLGENVCVCGANVGKHCVIAANSVVTKDIPDYCVAAGSPAKVVKTYNFETKKWEKI